MLTHEGEEQNNFQQAEDLFYKNGKLISIPNDDIYHLEKFTSNQPNYAIFYDNPNQLPKSFISKYLNENHKFKLVDYEKLSNQLKEKLGSEEGENLTFAQLLEQFKIEIDEMKQNEILLFDGFPYELNQLEKMIHKCGQP